MNSKDTKTTAPESQEAQDPTLGGNTPSETSQTNTGDDNDTSPISAQTPTTNTLNLGGFDTVRKHILDNDAEGLSRMLYGKCEPNNESFVFGEAIRELVCLIALQPKPSNELVNLAVKMVGPWVIITDFIRFIDAANPGLHLLEEPTEPLSPADVSTLANGDLMKQHGNETFVILLKNLYALCKLEYEQLRELLPDDISSKLANGAVNFNLFPDTRTALLCLMQFIPTVRDYEIYSQDANSSEGEEMTHTEPALNPGDAALLSAIHPDPTEPMEPLKKPQSDRQSHDVGDQETALLPPYATDFGRDLTSQCYAALNGNP